MRQAAVPCFSIHVSSSERTRDSVNAYRSPRFVAAILRENFYPRVSVQARNCRAAGRTCEIWHDGNDGDWLTRSHARDAGSTGGSSADVSDLLRERDFFFSRQFVYPPVHPVYSWLHVGSPSRHVTSACE